MPPAVPIADLAPQLSVGLESLKEYVVLVSGGVVNAYVEPPAVSVYVVFAASDIELEPPLPSSNECVCPEAAAPTFEYVMFAVAFPL